ncbi:MAG: hypothetical protein KDE55_12440 [Novosphingobium sp.]|nr:hypothetical protein [Novosphingobium sp.]
MGTVLSLLVLLSLAMLGGAWLLWRKGGSRKQIALMVALAVIAIANVAIWTIPDSSGESPLDAVPG